MTDNSYNCKHNDHIRVEDADGYGYEAGGSYWIEMWKESSCVPQLVAALNEARDFAIRAIEANVHVKGFNPADHVTVKQIDAALLATRQATASTEEAV